MADKTNIDILINTANSATNVRELKKALRELVSAQEGVDKSSPDFSKLAAGITDTESRIGDLNDSFKTLAGSGMERLTTSSYLLRDGLNNLDLDKIKIGLGGLKQLPKALAVEFTKLAVVIKGLNFKTLGTSMKTLGESGVGALTKSIVQLGKAILTNPILLLAAVIIGIVAVVVKFYDKIIPLRLAVEAFGAAIDVVIQALKDFADWIGITDFAASEAAQNQIDNAKKTEEALTRKYDQEIAMAEAAGEKTFEIEKKKLEMIQKTNGEAIAGIQKQISVEGDANGEKKALLQEHLLAIEDAYNKGLVLDRKNKKQLDDDAKKTAQEGADKYKKSLEDKRKLREEFEQVMDDLSIKAINNELDREIAANLLSYTNDLDKYKKKYQVDDDGRAKTSELQIRWDAYELKRTASYQTDDLKIRQKYQTKSVAAQKQYIDTMLQLNELLIREPGKDGYLDSKKTAEFLQKQFELSQESLAKTLKLLDDEGKERKLAYQGDAAMISTISAEINAKKVIATTEVNNKMREVNKAYTDTLQNDELAALEVRLEKSKEGSEEELNAKIAVLAKKADMELQNTELTENQKKLIVTKFTKEINQLILDEENNKNLKLNSLTDAYLSEKGKKNLEAFKQIAAGLNSVISEAGALMAQNSANELAEYDRKEQEKTDLQKSQNAQREQDISDAQAIELANFTGTEEERVALQTKFAQDKVTRENAQKMLEYETALENYNNETALKKKAFDQNKKMQMASAIISGALAVVNGLAMAPFIPVGIVAAASAAITAGINIAKIASSQFQGGGSPPQKPVLANPAAVGLSGSGSGGGGSGSGGNFSAPSFYKLGQGGGFEGGKMAQRVYVLESDITKTQKGIQRVETRATTTL